MQQFQFILVTASFVSAAFFQSACYNPEFKVGLPCSETRQCPAGQFCNSSDICVREDGPDEPDAGEVPLDCEPNSLVCESDVLTQCNAQGTGGVQTDCVLGCNDSEVRCNKLDPSNGLAEHLDDAEANGPDVILSSGATFNTETGVVTNGDGSVVDVPQVLLPAPVGGVEIRVFKFGSLRMSNASTINDSKGIAIVSARDISVLGSFSIAPSGTLSGTCTYPSFTHSGTPGGAGGGFGQVGGDGGSGSGSARRPGGLAAGDETLIPLRGGCRGLISCSTTPCLASCTGSCLDVGRGGGALQLVSGTSVLIEAAGRIEAHGTGAEGGASDTVSGAGGGSGGAILVEAPTVSVIGALAANGGGGSCRNRTAGPGTLAGTLNGSGCASPDGSGGSGGTSTRNAVSGADASGSGGSGGGSVGRIRVNSKEGGFSQDASAVLSPAASTGTIEVR